MRKLLLSIAIGALMACQTMEPDEMIDGGWIKQKVDSQLVREAYAFASREAGRRHKGIQLMPPRSAESRVTQGTEVRMECPFEMAGKKGISAVLVFEDLNGKMELVSIVLSP